VETAAAPSTKIGKNAKIAKSKIVSYNSSQTPTRLMNSINYLPKIDKTFQNAPFGWTSVPGVTGVHYCLNGLP